MNGNYISPHSLVLLTLVVLQEHAYALPAPWPVVIDALAELAEDPDWLMDMRKRGVLGQIGKTGVNMITGGGKAPDKPANQKAPDPAPPKSADPAPPKPTPSNDKASQSGDSPKSTKAPDKDKDSSSGGSKMGKAPKINPKTLGLGLGIGIPAIILLVTLGLVVAACCCNWGPCEKCKDTPAESAE